MNDFWVDILKTVRTISFPDILDIVLVAILFYFIYKFLRDRRSGKLVIGVLFLVLLYVACGQLDMYVTRFILQNVFQVGIIVAAVVFQPELRSALEKVGGQPMKSIKNIASSNNHPELRMISEVSTAAASLSASKTGALIVLERLTKLGDLILTGTVIDAEPNVAIIKNIFFNKAPLHDGALIIRNSRLYAAGCVLPLTSNTDIDGDLGTRHRAAIGTSENSDAVIIVVSEETGTISIAVEGVLYRGYNRESLEAELKRRMIDGGDTVQKRLSKLHKSSKKLFEHTDGNGGASDEK